MDRPQQEDTRCFCKPCNRYFPDWATFFRHKKNMRKNGAPDHVHCSFCGADFVTEDAEWTHIQQFHPEEQSLECPGCGHGPFTRLGGLIAHIEDGQCARISTSMLDDMREKKLEFPRMLQALTKHSIKGNYSSYFSAHSDTASSKQGQWFVPDRRPAFTIKDQDFPNLASQKADSASVAATQKETHSGWDNKKNLFPNAPAAQRPTDEQLEAATGPSARSIHESMDPEHPNHPGFNVRRYHNAEAELFICPKPLCIKAFNKAGGLIGHLRSPAHGDTTYHCPRCHKRFKTLTAITQHVESSSVQCKIRDATDFDSYLDQLTAGLVNVDLNRNEDGTVRYSTTESSKSMFGGGNGDSEKKENEDPLTGNGDGWPSWDKAPASDPWNSNVPSQEPWEKEGFW